MRSPFLASSWRCRWALVVGLFIAVLAACSTSASPPQAGNPSPLAAPTRPPATSEATSQTGAISREDGPGTRFTLVPTFSKASYRAHEQLRGVSFPNEAVGSTRDVSGSLALDQVGAIRTEQSQITADLRSLRSDEPIRDNYIQQNTLQTARFPTATFQPRELSGVSMPLPTGRELPVTLTGELTVHGTSRPVTWSGSVQLEGDTLSGTFSTSVTITEFGMALPSVFRVLSLDDALTLEIEFQAQRAPASS